MGVIAILGGQAKQSSKCRTRLQTDDVAAFCPVDCFLQIVTLVDLTKLTLGGGVGQRAFYLNPRQFRGAVKAATAQRGVLPACSSSRKNVNCGEECYYDNTH